MTDLRDKLRRPTSRSAQTILVVRTRTTAQVLSVGPDLAREEMPTERLAEYLRALVEGTRSSDGTITIHLSTDLGGTGVIAGTGIIVPPHPKGRDVLIARATTLTHEANAVLHVAQDMRAMGLPS